MDMTATIIDDPEELKLEEPMKSSNPASHIPTNYFMDWFRKRIEPFKEQSCHDDKRYAETIKVNLHYSEKKYLTEFVTDEEISSWNPQKPVFISAQTGTGKNYFVQNQLLRHLYEENKRTKRNDKILILSNRIALGRQSKQDFAESIAKITGNASFFQRIDNYTPRGLDQEYSNFGMVQILSYQAFAGSNILSEYNFKYIICDECHFFTSDSTFNPYTDEIMQKIIGKARNAVRIYMSATPNGVFAPIILEEYRLLSKSESEKNTIFSLSLPPRVNRQRIISDRREKFDKLYNIANKESYTGIEQCKEPVDRMAADLNIEFYYMERNYDYIENFYYYGIDKELLNEVVKTDKNNKWLIFVSSKRKGNDLLKKIKKANSKISVVFLKSESKFLSDESTKAEKHEKASYEKLVNEQTFDEDVLITTSVLDNGVNIKAKSIKNVVIDYCDGTEFVQMLGRLRISQSTKLNLYVPLYSSEKIQKQLKQNIQFLVERLLFDVNDSKFKEVKFGKNKKFYRYTHNEEFATYNSNAIWQLINSINFQMSLLKTSDSKFNLETLTEFLKSNKILSDKDALNFYADCRKVYNYYMQKDSRKIWGRNIIDILTTEDDLKQRQKWVAEDKKFDESCDRYDFKFTDTFSRYLFEVLLPKFFDKAIEKEINATLSQLKDGERIDYQTNRLDFIDSMDGVKKLHDKKEYYHGLGTSKLQTDLNFEDMLLNEQMKWLEKNIDDCQPITTESQISKIHDLQEYIIENAVPLEEIESQKSGDYIQKVYLQEHGIPHDEKNPTDEEIRFCEEFRGGKPFNRGEVNKDCLETDKYEYRLNSYNATGEGHKTYYVFVKIEKE